MATYIPGAKSYLPDFQPFTPDFKFLSNALDVRTDKYETNYKQLNDLYGKVVYADLSRGDTNEVRDQYANELAPRLEQIASMDLSLAQNVDAAKGVFMPFFENDLVVKDMVATDQYRKELSFANRLLNSNDPDVRDKYWDVGIRGMEYQMKDFIDASPDKALQMSIPKYVQNVNLAKRAEEILKESGYGDMESIEWSPDGRYIINTTGGAQVAAPAYELLQSQLLSDPRVTQAYYTDAYVQMRDYVDNGMNEGMFSDMEAGKQAWANTTISAVEEQLGLQLQTAQNEQDVAKQNAEEWETYNNVYGIGAGTPEEKAMADALNEYEASRKKTTRYDAALQEAATPTTDTDALLNRAYNLMMQTNIAGDLQTSALRYAEITRRIEIDEDPYFLADYKHRLKMNEIYYKASLSGSGSGGDDKTSEQRTTDDIMLDINSKLGTYGDFGKVVIPEDETYEYSQDALDNQASSLQSEAVDLWVGGSMLLEQAAGTDGRLTFQAYDTPDGAAGTGLFGRMLDVARRATGKESGASELKTYNVLPNEAKEILNRPENKEIAIKLMQDRYTQLNTTNATDVQLATSLPSLLNEGGAYFPKPLTQEQYELEQSSGTAMTSNNSLVLNGYPVAVNSPQIIAAVRSMSDGFRAKENLLVTETEMFNTNNLNNFRNIMQTAEGQELMGNSYRAGFPTIFDGVEFVNGDLYGNAKPGGILSKTEYVGAFVDYYSNLSGNQNSFRVDANNAVIRKYGAISNLVMSDEVRQDVIDKEYNESILEAALKSYDSQKDLLDLAYKKGSTGNAAYSAPRNLNAIFNGTGDGLDGLSVAGTQITGTVNPRSENPDVVGYSILNEAITLMQDPSVEVKYRAVGYEDDLRGTEKNWDDLSNTKLSEDFVNNVLLPDLLALYENPGGGEQTTSDLYFTIDKTNIANITDNMDDAITTYTLNINPLYIDKYKQTGETGVDVFGTTSLEAGERANRTTDFTKVQIRVKKSDIDRLIPTEIGDVGQGRPEFSIMRSQGQYTYSLPRGGGYTIWNSSDNPLEVGISASRVMRNENGQYVSIPDIGGNIQYDANGQPYTSVRFNSMAEFNQAITQLNEEILQIARQNNLYNN